MELTFRAPAKKLDDVDLPRIASEIQCGEDELHAVLDVETSGGSADSKGRLKMLFEPHVFYRELKGAERDAAVKAGIAYPNWRSGYPADSYPRLMKAIAINETAALMAASWGLGQILGENYKLAGYESPQAMVAAFSADEENHLQAMVDFIKGRGLARALARHDWGAFAYGYNGPKYAAHGYDKKLAAAHAKWSKIPDTPWDGKPAPKLMVGDLPVDVQAPALVPDTLATAVTIKAAPLSVTPIALPLPPIDTDHWIGGAPAAKKTGDGGALGWFGFVAVIAAAVWKFAAEYWPEILISAIALVILATIIFRLMKGHWPWIGQHSHLSLPASLPSSADSSAQRLLDHLEALRALSPAMPSPAPSASRQLPTQLVPKLPAIRKRRPALKGSKPSTRTRSFNKRKSKSRG